MVELVFEACVKWFLSWKYWGWYTTASLFNDSSTDLQIWDESSQKTESPFTGGAWIFQFLSRCEGILTWSYTRPGNTMCTEAAAALPARGGRRSVNRYILTVTWRKSGVATNESQWLFWVTTFMSQLGRKSHRRLPLLLFLRFISATETFRKTSFARRLKAPTYKVF